MLFAQRVTAAGNKKNTTFLGKMISDNIKKSNILHDLLATFAYLKISINGYWLAKIMNFTHFSSA